MNPSKLTVKYTSQFRKDYKLAGKRGLEIDLLKKVVALIANGYRLPATYKDHALSGNWAGHRECHIRPDWLLIYRIDENILVLTLVRTGTHSEIFGI